MPSTCAMRMVEHPIVGLVTKSEHDALPTLPLRNMADLKSLRETLRGGLEEAAGTATRKRCLQADDNSSPKRHRQAGSRAAALPAPSSSTVSSPDKNAASVKSSAKTPTKTTSVKTSSPNTPQRADPATMRRRPVAHPTPPSEKKKSQYPMILEAGKKATEAREKKRFGRIVHKVESKEDTQAARMKRALDNADSPTTTEKKKTGSSVLGVVPERLWGKSSAVQNITWMRTGLPDTSGRNKGMDEMKRAKEKAKIEKERAKRAKEEQELKERKETEITEKKRKDEELFDELFG
ncbi:uncharacterized protein BDZ99DRAFT_549835 [Mytilinidion resinicola]|uniref:Uncharacterized protein n=1 Tax=Mytilinidion resinicola TaxID=574789 RepID=A0A6A6Z350_9PEZI|nr:uncharacterized protein BDZ99DRAFT_549835 [Mytilinidion resinicola]KAF2815248.1 hypothetical protein BDZ99DRAFT_549835 [Mytilinidion resinicola]